jgi:hypothetical protein
VPPLESEEELNRGEEGSASIELVGVLPFLLLAILVAAQLALAGQALWSSAIARADLVGESGTAAARSALPPSLRDGAEVEAGDRISVAVPVPRLPPVLPGVKVGAKTKLGPGNG